MAQLITALFAVLPLDPKSPEMQDECDHHTKTLRHSTRIAFEINHYASVHLTALWLVSGSGLPSDTHGSSCPLRLLLLWLWHSLPAFRSIVLDPDHLLDVDRQTAGFSKEIWCLGRGHWWLKRNWKGCHSKTRFTGMCYNVQVGAAIVIYAHFFL